MKRMPIVETSRLLEGHWSVRFAIRPDAGAWDQCRHRRSPYNRTTALRARRVRATLGLLL